MLENARHQVGRRSRQMRSLMAAEGAAGVRSAMRRGLLRRLGEGQTELLVRPADVLAAETDSVRWTTAAAATAGGPLTLNWVVSPPSPGSGGHTTMFRLIRHLEARGHRSRVYFYDIYGGDHAYYTGIVRESFGFSGEVANIDDGMKPAAAVVATSWPTVYAAAAHSSPGRRFYLVQDYEPLFYAVGSNSTLAENTYRMGFHGVTAGRWLAGKLSAEFGMAADYFDFGSDTDLYHLDRDGERDGVVFYARPSTPRRGTEIGLMALELFKAAHPEITVHVYGERVAGLRFPAVQHGTLRPDALNSIYNSCIAGLSLSLTNVSLVPHEMLAAGCIPVVNDAPQNRIVLDNDHVRYTSPSPQALAAELSRVVTTDDFAALAKRAAESVRGNSWDNAATQVEAVLVRETS
jgi:O-antigen biosynthesis protein